MLFNLHILNTLKVWRQPSDDILLSNDTMAPIALRGRCRHLPTGQIGPLQSARHTKESGRPFVPLLCTRGNRVDISVI